MTAKKTTVKKEVVKTASKKKTPIKKTPVKNAATTEVLNGVSDIRRFFHKNETPLYFISATNFNMLGADEWIKDFKFISHIECFLSLIHISEPTRRTPISYAVFCLKKKKKNI